LTRVGVTGHQELPDDSVAYLVEGVRAVLHDCAPPLRVVTALATGADQLVAREVLRDGGSVHAIVPAGNYESTFSPGDLHHYKFLIAQADEVTRLDFPEPSEQAYWAAGKAVVDGCDLLVAIWDGEPARGLGGTGDVVAYATDLGKDVRVIWPGGTGRR
jgi:hypothetical protein